MKNSSRETKKLEFKQRLEYLKKAVDYGYLLQTLGFESERDTYKETRSACLIHGGDNKTAFRFNKELGTWVCFTNKCHEVFGNDVIGLIKAVRRVDFMDAVRFLEDLVGDVGDFSLKLMKFRMDKETDRLLSISKKHADIPAMVNEKSLDQFKPFRSNRFIKDGYEPYTLDHFEVAGGYTDSFSLVRDIIPIRDENNKLLAYSMRDIRDDVEDDSFKYLLTPGFDKDKVLYNLNNAKAFYDDRPLIVVEGFKSVWRLYEYGIENVVAVMGSYITEGQQTLLYAHAKKGVIIMFDNDKAGVAGVSRAFEDLKGGIRPIIPVYITEVDANGGGLDPSDLNKEQVYGYLRGLFEW